jgi:tRNA/tmRNA/rRNA uracil-C5-methylase (TrmA/RlmC/RlmD family)
MEWSKDLYDEFRMRRTFGNVSDEKTEKEVDFIYEVLKLYNTAKVLDLFCDIGRHSIEIAKRGCKPVGIEYNLEYLKLAREQAKEKGISVEFIQGDVRYVDIGESYDGAIIMFNSFGYFSDE